MTTRCMKHKTRIEELADPAIADKLSDEVADMEAALDPDKMDYKRMEAMLVLKTLQRDVHVLAMGMQELLEGIALLREDMVNLQTSERMIANLERAIGRSKVA